MSDNKGEKEESRGNDRGKPDLDDKQVSIIVNGRPKIVTGKQITFEQIVALADNLPTGPNILYTITYRKSAGNKAEGTVVAGDSVKIKDGTTFSVIPTDKS